MLKPIKLSSGWWNVKGWSGWVQPQTQGGCWVCVNVVRSDGSLVDDVGQVSAAECV